MEEWEGYKYCSRSWQTYLENKRASPKVSAEEVVEIQLLDHRSTLKINTEKEVSSPQRAWKMAYFCFRVSKFQLSKINRSSNIITFLNIHSLSTQIWDFHDSPSFPKAVSLLPRGSPETNLCLVLPTTASTLSISTSTRARACTQIPRATKYFFNASQACFYLHYIFEAITFFIVLLRNMQAGSTLRLFFFMVLSRQVLIKNIFSYN